MASSSVERRYYQLVTASASNDGASNLPQLVLYLPDGTPHVVNTQMPLQSNPAALTSAAAAGATPTKAEFDKTVVDLGVLRTAITDLLTKLKTADLMASS